MTDDDPRTYAGWVSAFHGSTDFEADIVRDRLDEAGIPAVVLTQRDHSFNLNVGDLAPVHVMVKPEDLDAARAVVAAPAVSDAELEAAALAADVMAPDAHTPAGEAMLDSGMESLSFDVPSDDDLAAADASPGASDAGGDDARPAVGHLSFAASAPAVSVYDAPSDASMTTPPDSADPAADASASDDPETAGAYDPTGFSGPSTADTDADDPAAAANTDDDPPAGGAPARPPSPA